MKPTINDMIQTLLKEADKGPCRYGESFWAPRQIYELTIRDTGPIKKLEARFRKNSLNAVFGGGMSGKSTIIRSILHSFGREHEYFKPPRVTITMKTFPEKVGKCLLVDDAFSTVSTELPSLLRELRKLHTQVIATFRFQDLETIRSNVDQIIVLKGPSPR